MTLAQALSNIRQQKDFARARQLFLVCGFEALHLPTFLRGHFAERHPDQALEVKTGLYGDLTGSLSTAAASSSDAALLVLEWADIDSRLGLRSTGGWSFQVQPDIVANCRDRFARLLNGLRETAARMPVVVAPPTLPIPLFSHAAGWQMSRNELELDRLLSNFLAEAGALDRVTILSAGRLDKLSPAGSRLDAAMELKAGFPYTLGHASVVADLAVSSLFPPSPMKGLITDLDDTFWSGIVGETGAAGVHWCLSEHSQIHGIYQQLLRHFSEMGVLLAIASKNELAVVGEALQRQDLLIPGTAFHPVRADWGAKSRHIAEILRTWNIGADSVVFVDDSPMELDEVRAAFPAMTCLQFPKKHPAQALALFEQLRDLFGKPSVQKEDALRQASIQARDAFEQSATATDAGEFLRGLQGSVTFDFRKDPSNRRLFELINKTNQFNLNGVRLTEGEWLRHLANPASFVASISYEDKFGPLGVIGVLAGERKADELSISTWVLSCRAFSRRIEFHTLAHLFESTQAGSISLAFRATDRNQPLQEFFQSLPFSDTSGETRSLNVEQFRGADFELPHRVSVIQS